MNHDLTQNPHQPNGPLPVSRNQIGEFLRLLSTAGWQEPSPDVLCRAFNSLHGASWSVLFSVDRTSGRLDFLAEHNLPDALKSRLEWLHAVASEVSDTGLGVCLNGKEAASLQRTAHPPGYSIIAIPLFIKAVITGVLVEGRLSDFPFSEDDVEKSINLAPFAALFLANILILETVRAQKTEVEEDRKKLLALNTELEKNIKKLQNSPGELEKAVNELSSSARAKTEFCQNLSDDMRTPRTPIHARSEAWSA